MAKLPPRRARKPHVSEPTTAAPQAPVALPTREDILRFLAENPSKGSKRELARAFDVSGDDRRALKEILHGLEEEGLIEVHQRKIATPGMLPATCHLQIIGRNRDGDLEAEPVDWGDSEKGRPRVLILSGGGNRRKANEPAPGVGDQILARIVDVPRGYIGAAKQAARTIKILERKPISVLGVFRANQFGGGRIEPVSRRQSEMIVEPGNLNGAEDGDLVTVEVIRTNKYGLGHAKVVNRVGSLTSEKAVSMIAIYANDIPHIFPPQVLDEAEAARPARMDGREDWRDVPFVTIDPADAKDHDDAVFATPDLDPANKGGQIVTVAIADVAAYIRPNSAMDKEALHRGNSVYFPDRVVPMLPERISNDLCSLRENEDRPALAVRMIFSAEGVKIKHSFHRIMMRSVAKLAYQQAQAAIDGQVDDKTAPLLEPVLKPLYAAYEVLKAGRDNRSPLDLDLPERKILLHKDGTVDRVIVPERLEAHRLIEECMIQANVAAAETLEAKRTPLVYRIHDEPSLTKLEGLREFLSSLDIKLAKQGALRPEFFNKILARAHGTDNQHLVNEMVLRAQSQAQYNPENIGHFGLNLRRYAHFTSPIRRYADLIVHRALVTALRLGNDGLSDAEIKRLEFTAQEISAAERRAMTAERETIDRLIAEWLSTKINEEFEGRIGGVTKAGLFIKLEDTGADGFVPVSTLGEEFFVFDEVKMALIGDRSGTTYRLGDIVLVKLVEVAPLAGALRFEMLSNGKKGKVPAGIRRRPSSAKSGPGRAAPGRSGPPGRSGGPKRGKR